jgi:glycosyltransferase involved in cell wall biosynthesis
MRIALVYLGRRGAGGPISMNIASHLSKRAEVLVILSELNKSLETWENTGVELVALPTYRGILGAVWAWIDPRPVCRIALQIRTWKPDVLFFPMFYTWNPLLQQNLKEFHSVVAVHDPVPHPGLMGIVYRLLEDISIRQATRVLLFSQIFVKELKKRGVRTERIDILPLAGLQYEQEYPQNQPKERQSESSMPCLLYFGRIEKYKGLEILLKSFQEISREMPVKLQIVGAGSLRPYRSLLKGLSNVEIINRWVEDSEIASYFEQATAVVLPYTSASQSGVIQVAAGYGLPVISTRVGGIPEQIEDGRTGLLVEPNSIEGLTEAIRQLLTTNSLAEELGRNLEREYRKLRNWDLIAEKVFEICVKATYVVQPS